MFLYTVSQSNQRMISPKPSSLPAPKTCESSSRIPATIIWDGPPVAARCQFGLTRCKTSHSLTISFPPAAAQELEPQPPSLLVSSLPNYTKLADSRINLLLQGWQQQSVLAVDIFKGADTLQWQIYLE